MSGSTSYVYFESARGYILYYWKASTEKKMSQILLGSVVYATWDVLLEVGFVLLLLMYSTRFMMYDTVDIYTYFRPFVLLKSFVQMCKSISYAQSTFNDKTNHSKINDNYVFFLIRWMVKRMSTSQRHHTLKIWGSNYYDCTKSWIHNSCFWYIGVSFSELK